MKELIIFINLMSTHQDTLLNKLNMEVVELNFEISELKHEINKLKLENEQLKQIIEEIFHKCADKLEYMTVKC